jgi:hypothetical protein
LAEVGRTSLALNAALAALYPSGGAVHDSLSQLGSRDVAFSKIRDSVR